MDKIVKSLLALSIVVYIAGCGSGEAMPLSNKNIDEYMTNSSNAANSVDPEMEQMKRIEIVAKETMEKMGYSFDKTVLNTLKIAYNAQMSGERTQVHMYGFMDQIASAIADQPSEAVSSGLVSEDTKNKIVSYYNCRTSNGQSIVEGRELSSGICSDQQQWWLE